MNKIWGYWERENLNHLHDNVTTVPLIKVKKIDT